MPDGTIRADAGKIASAVSVLRDAGEQVTGVRLDGLAEAALRSSDAVADDLDPDVGGRHQRKVVPDDVGRFAADGLRSVGRFAGALGTGVTVLDGVRSYEQGETTAVETVVETAGALGGGMVGGMAAGAAAGSFFGPAGIFVGVGIGAFVGSEVGKGIGDWTHETLSGD